MKKTLALVQVILLLLSLSACGAKEAVQDAVREAVDGSTSIPSESSGSAQQSTSQQGDAPAGDDDDISTVEGRLAKAGLTLDAIKPDTFAEASLYNCDTDEIVLYLSNDSGQLGAAVMQPMIEKILATTADASDDGQNWEAYYGLGEPTPLNLSETNYDVWYFIGQWSYRVNGQWIILTVGVVPAEEPEGQENYAWEVTLAFLY